jgi:hypothetical protein
LGTNEAGKLILLQNLAGIIFFALSVLVTFEFCAAAQEEMSMPASKDILDLGFENTEWRFTSQGKYLLVKDPRSLYQFYHPWDISEDGDFAAISAQVTVSQDWQNPIFLKLYANDTYVSEGWKEAKPRWTHTYAAYHNFVAHRFKQVLIDDEMVWERDVGDSEDFGYFNLDVSDYVRPGQSFTLTLRVLDKVSSATKLPGDEFHLGIWSWSGLGDPDAEKKFYTRVFWGDVALSAGEPVPWEHNPARQDAQLNPISMAADKPVEFAEDQFTLSCPSGLGNAGYIALLRSL